MVTAKYQSFPTEIYTSQGYGNFEEKPIVVLIDGMTASAGEIIAMTLQEQIKAGTQLRSAAQPAVQPLQQAASPASAAGVLATVVPTGLTTGHTYTEADLTQSWAVDPHAQQQQPRATQVILSPPGASVLPQQPAMPAVVAPAPAPTSAQIQANQQAAQQTAADLAAEMERRRRALRESEL